MRYILTLCSLFLVGGFHQQLKAHCQMPCGIYHDDMVFDQIDQYVETMVKCVSILMENKSTTPHDKNEFIRWVMLKDKLSDETAQLILTFFLQQKIKPDESDTIKRLTSAHKLLFYLVTIKQTVEYKYLNDFYEEWEKFKLMFHIEGYECKMEQIKLKEWQKKRDKATLEEQKQNQSPNHEHDHDHDHADHTHSE